MGSARTVSAVDALLMGRTHFTRADDGLYPAPSCSGAMLPVFTQGGSLMGYYCPRCGTTADTRGRTEHGPRVFTEVGPPRIHYAEPDKKE